MPPRPIGSCNWYRSPKTSICIALRTVWATRQTLPFLASQATAERYHLAGIPQVLLTPGCPSYHYSSRKKTRGTLPQPEGVGRWLQVADHISLIRNTGKAKCVIYRATYFNLFCDRMEHSIQK